MSTFFSRLSLFASVFASVASGQGRPTNAPIYITHVTVIDTETGKEAPDRTVVISGDRISEIKASKGVKTPSGSKVVDGTGKYLIPGLWDMHVHVWDYDSTFPLFLANGVTGVRDMFGPTDANKFRAELTEKKILAPHFYLASPIIDGHPKVWPTSIEVSTPEEARKVVDEQKQKGADFIKVYSRLSRESYFAIVEESRRQKIPFEGHVPTLISAWEASNARQRSFEHLNGIPLACSSREEELQTKMAAAMTTKERFQVVAEGSHSHSEEKCQRLFAEFKKNGTWQVPTLTVNRSFAMLNNEQFRKDERLRYFGGDYRNGLVAKDDFRLKAWTAEDFAVQHEIFAYNQRIVGAMFRAGVPLLAGIDARNPFCFPGFSLHDELGLMVESGVSPLGALRAATRNPAIFMDATDKYGSVTPGKLADLVLLDADPLKDIHNTTKISEVFLIGKEFDRAALDQMLRNAESAAKASGDQTANLPFASQGSANQTPAPAVEVQGPAKDAVADLKQCTTLAGAGQAPWSVNSSEFILPLFTTPIVADRGTTVTVAVPFCRVIGTVKPTPESDIRFELWLPPRAAWNEKFEGVGSGGSRGQIVYDSLMRGLVRGYATAATDNGHQSTSGYDVSWALGQPERVIDFGYRAEHTVTQAAKELTQRFYGRAPRHSYFVGCSQGGHHAMMEAQRFPEDYDGIIAGAPVYSWTGEMTEQTWNVRVLQRTPTGALPSPKLQLLYEAVAKACAGVDGLIDDPRQCSFDPGVLRCASADQNACLTASEIDAVRQMYAGPKTSAGAQIYPGLWRGSEIGWDRLWSDPKKHLGGSWDGFFQFMVFQNSAWDLSMLDFDRDTALAKQKFHTILDPDNPDLSAFAKRGGKIIVYHGSADDMVPSQVSTDYYDSVTSRLGSNRVKEFYRLFMIPGMCHCGRGPGANVLFRSEDATAVPLEPDRDLLTALEQWVEHGRAPSSFIPSRLNKGGAVERTRLVCPYPSIAKYRGTGDLTRAENFTCSLQ